MPIDLKQFKFEDVNDHWLDNMTYSQAMIRCIGSGPWRIERRRRVQQRALDMLGNNDLSMMIFTPDIFPLAWQYKLLSKICDGLRGGSFEVYCLTADAMDIYNLCGTRTKVISLFIRDKMNMPAFPIDRHVKRWLVENNLPTNEIEMLRYCFNNDVDPNKLNRWIVRQRFTGNPN